MIQFSVFQNPAQFEQNITTTQSDQQNVKLENEREHRPLGLSGSSTGDLDLVGSRNAKESEVEESTRFAAQQVKEKT